MDAVEYSWFVYGRTTLCGKYAQGTCLSAVTIYYGSEVIQLQRGFQISYQGKKHNPMLTPGIEVKIGEAFVAFFDDEAAYLEVSVTLNAVEGSRKIVVRWDGYVSALVQSPSDTLTWGLCGNNDNDGLNDLWSPRYAVESDSIEEFGETWRMNRDACSDLVEDYHLEDECKERLEGITEECNRVFLLSTFDECGSYHDRENFIKACIYDECKGINILNPLSPIDTLEFDDKFSPKCVILEAYAMRCEAPFWDQGKDKEISFKMTAGWEKEAGCPSAEERKEDIRKQGCI